MPLRAADNTHPALGMRHAAPTPQPLTSLVGGRDHSRQKYLRAYFVDFLLAILSCGNEGTVDKMLVELKSLFAGIFAGTYKSGRVNPVLGDFLDFVSPSARTEGPRGRRLRANEQTASN